MSIFHSGHRDLQDRFDTRRLADRLEEVKVHVEIGEGDKEFIERADMFFLATADEEGRPNCSYKGGDPGFVRVVDPRTIAFPNYDGNGMYLSMGNVERSSFVPKTGHETPFPDWKRSGWARDVLPQSDARQENQ